MIMTIKDNSFQITGAGGATAERVRYDSINFHEQLRRP